MKKFWQILWNMLRNNLLLKIMALLFAVVLWSYVLAETNPPRERVVPDVPVKYENMEELKAKDLAISKSLSESLETVDVSVEVNQSDLKYLNKENIQAYIDLSTISGTGERTLDVAAKTSSGEVLGKSPSKVKLYIDHYVTRTVPVNVNLTGSVPSGYYASTPQILPDVISISGALVDVEKVASAVCTIDLDGLTQGYKKSVVITLLDENGGEVDSSLFDEDLPSVIANLTVLSKKTVPIDVQDAIIGQDNLAPGVEITGITCTPAAVTIVGEKSVLDTVDAIQLVPYSVSGASTDVVVLLDYAPPDGVSVLSTEKVQVNIGIREVMDTKTYHNIKIQQKNLSSGLQATIDQSTVDVTVIAGQPRLSALDKSQIVPYVDLEDLAPGEYTLDVLFEVPEGFTADNFSSSVNTVTVTVKNK